MTDHSVYIERAEEFLLKADKILHDSNFKNILKLKISGILLSIVIDHVSAGFVLYKEKKYNSMFALIRIIYESLLRAIWVKNCATEREVELFLEYDEVLKAKGKKYSAKELVTAVDGVLEANNIFSKIHSYWARYCSFTHSGVEQIKRNIHKNNIIQNHSDFEIQFYAKFMLSCGMFAIIQIGDLTDKSKDIDNLISEFAAFSEIDPSITQMNTEGNL